MKAHVGFAAAVALARLAPRDRNYGTVDLGGERLSGHSRGRQSRKHGEPETVPSVCAAWLDRCVCESLCEHVCGMCGMCGMCGIDAMLPRSRSFVVCRFVGVPCSREAVWGWHLSL